MTNTQTVTRYELVRTFHRTSGRIDTGTVESVYRLEQAEALRAEFDAKVKADHWNGQDDVTIRVVSL